MSTILDIIQIITKEFNLKNYARLKQSPKCQIYRL